MAYEVEDDVSEALEELISMYGSLCFCVVVGGVGYVHESLHVHIRG